jgi:hypothetical protein
MRAASSTAFTKDRVMDSIFTRPETVFPARQIADDITVLANQTVEKIIADLKKAYHETWAVDGLRSGSRRTQQQQQEVIDNMDLISLAQMRSAAGAMVETIRSLCVALVGMEAADVIIPAAYLLPAWELTTSGTFGAPDFRVIVGSLKAEWMKPSEGSVA